MRWRFNRYRRTPAGDPTFSPEVGFAFSATPSAFTVTKTGGGFGTKPQGGAAYFWTDPGTTGVVAAEAFSRWTGWGGLQQGTLAQARVAPGSSYSVQHDLAASTTTAYHAVDLGQTPDRWYVWVKRYWDFQPATIDAGGGATYGFNHKQLRAWGSTGLSYPNIYMGCGWLAGATTATHTGTHENITQGWAQGWTGGGNLTRQLEPRPSGPLHQIWLITEWIVRHNATATSTDGLFHTVNNGLAGVTVTQRTPFQSWNAAFPLKPNVIVLDQRSNGTYTVPAWVAYDSLYVEDSWCRVVLSDEPTWQDTMPSEGAVSRRREIQPVTAWSDTQVSGVLRLGSHTGFTGLYLYVVTNDGTASRIGQFH